MNAQVMDPVEKYTKIFYPACPQTLFCLKFYSASDFILPQTLFCLYSAFNFILKLNFASNFILPQAFFCLKPYSTPNFILPQTNSILP